MGTIMTEQAILSLRDHGNYNELLACRVLERNGIRNIPELEQFVSHHGWDKIAYHFRGMGPVKFEAFIKMVERSGLV